MKILNIFVLVSIFITFLYSKVLASPLIVKKTLTGINLSHFNNINAFLEGNHAKAKRERGEGDHSLETKNACKNEQKSFKDCYTIEEKKIDEEICKMVSEDRCDKFFKDPVTYIPSCGKFDKSMGDGLNALYKFIGSFYHFTCANDRNCTIAKKIANKIELSNIQLNELSSPKEEDLNDDCHNKNCVDTATEMYENYREYVNEYWEAEKAGGSVNSTSEDEYKNEIDSINKTLEYLKSPACVQLSGAAKIIASNVLLISIITFILISLV